MYQGSDPQPCCPFVCSASVHEVLQLCPRFADMNRQTIGDTKSGNYMAETYVDPNLEILDLFRSDDEACIFAR